MPAAAKPIAAAPAPKRDASRVAMRRAEAQAHQEDREHEPERVDARADHEREEVHHHHLAAEDEHARPGAQDHGVAHRDVPGGGLCLGVRSSRSPARTAAFAFE